VQITGKTITNDQHWFHRTRRQHDVFNFANFLAIGVHDFFADQLRCEEFARCQYIVVAVSLGHIGLGRRIAVNIIFGVELAIIGRGLGHRRCIGLSGLCVGISARTGHNTHHQGSRTRSQKKPFHFKVLSL
jgi:hypothetical protein